MPKLLFDSSENIQRKYELIEVHTISTAEMLCLACVGLDWVTLPRTAKEGGVVASGGEATPEFIPSPFANESCSRATDESRAGQSRSDQINQRQHQPNNRHSMPAKGKLPDGCCLPGRLVLVILTSSLLYYATLLACGMRELLEGELFLQEERGNCPHDLKGHPLPSLPSTSVLEQEGQTKILRGCRWRRGKRGIPHKKKHCLDLVFQRGKQWNWSLQYLFLECSALHIQKVPDLVSVSGLVDFTSKKQQMLCICSWTKPIHSLRMLNLSCTYQIIIGIELSKQLTCSELQNNKEGIPKDCILH